MKKLNLHQKFAHSQVYQRTNQISEQIFYDLSKSNKKIGKYLDLYVGNVSEGNFREKEVLEAYQLGYNTNYYLKKK